jgi:hypothetical protein
MYEMSPQKSPQLLRRDRPWKLAEPNCVNQLRAEVGLDPLRPAPEPGPELPPEKQREIEHDHRWWEESLASKGCAIKETKVKYEPPSFRFPDLAISCAGHSRQDFGVPYSYL